MAFEQIWELVQGHILQGVLAVVVLPVLNWLVGRSKRDQAEREEQEMRHQMDLSIGLAELAARAEDPDSRRELEEMRSRSHDAFLRRAREHIGAAGAPGGSGFAKAKREKRYWIIPQPHGFFGWIWSILTVINLAFFVILVAALVAGLASGEMGQDDDLITTIVAMIFVVAIFALPTLLFRWFSFMSARMAARSRAKREAAAQDQAQTAAA
ncbi:MAG: hypothetical protein AAFW46_05145 [Pseudomonadota bacterium]